VYWFSPLTMNTFGIWEWSLFSEIFFYCLFPFIFAFAGKSYKNSIIWLWISLWIYILWNLAWSQAGGLMTLLVQAKLLTAWFAEWSTYIYHFPLYHFVDFGLGFLLLQLHKSYFNNKISSQNILLISIIHIIWCD
jgi:peptidoglycan/LPS O-acetylase OafA/YrhL